MDDRFFDLKKEKQDRILNGALKVFAISGYDNGSTDQIVKEAGISKGLLFHYFGTKKGLYLFLYDYSVRFLQLEIKGSVGKSDVDYFELQKQIVAGETAIMREYPYMTAFVDSAEAEDSPDLEGLQEKRVESSIFMRKILEQADYTRFRPEIDIQALTDLMNFTRQSLIRKLIIKDMLGADVYAQQIMPYFDMISKLAYR